MPQTITPNIFQQRLNHLFASTKATCSEVVNGTGGVIHEAYLWQLCTGRVVNPSYKVIAALANYFNVSPSYFFGEEGNHGIALLVGELTDYERKMFRQITYKLLSNP
jgi:transcriptional regulator with XRE-family HTH domain